MRIPLDGNWELFVIPPAERFSEVAKLSAYTSVSGAVPGNLELDLWRAGFGGDPLVGLNAKEYWAFENHDFWYRRTVECDFTGEAELVLEGVDLFAEIFFNGEYMYIHKLANGILSIELYGEDIFFTLAKTNDDTKDEDDENILIEECGDCDGEGYYTYQCYNCFGQGKVRKYTGRCSYCDGKGDNCFRCDYGLAYEYVDCQVCDDGYCKDVCGECKGEGQIIINLIPCPDCDGDGMQDADCHDCDGNGYTEDYSYQCLVCCGMWKSECDKCWGDGLLDYDETTGKNTTCNNCYGKGYIVCRHCNGPSKITCETCEGSGKGGKWCTTCYGKGKVRK